MKAALADLSARLRTAARVTVLTGAGVSAASGVPTFRGQAGLWKSFRPEQPGAPRRAFFARWGGAWRHRRPSHRDPRLVWNG